MLTIDDLEAGFHDGAKPPERWRLGVEHECPAVDLKGHTIPYHGPSGVGAVLGALAEGSDWKPVLEGDNTIALAGDGASITLEPGGQIEMSGRLWSSVHQARAEIDRHIDSLVTVGRKLGVRFLASGTVPKSTLEAIDWMPKRRYEIMRAIMERAGSLGHRMMKQTATVQSNFDYADEADARLKFRLCMALSPILVAMSANSPVIEGRLSGYKSYRAKVWTGTDPDRCGLLDFAFDTEGLFRAYTEYALDVPMYFLARNQALIPVWPVSFRQFLAKGHDGHQATLDDWHLHLSTIFTEVRLKTYIEVRSADSQAIGLVVATPAFVKGLLYERDCLEAAWDLVGRWSMSERLETGAEAARHGLAGRAGRHRLSDFAADLLGIAREGLNRQGQLDAEGRSEAVHLDALAVDVADGRCPADRIIEGWEGPWGGQTDRLIEALDYAG
jgi:glutamate--cysteine ligase